MSTDERHIQTRRLTVGGRPATVHVGGEGPPLLLVHGAWAGAEAHWGAVWERLARRYRVIAPELPGIATPPAEALDSLAAYARWLGAVLDALGVERALCVGNSFGGSVVNAFAAELPARCLGLVLVNGLALNRVPRVLQKFARRQPTRALLLALYRRLAFSPGARQRAFVHPERLPPGLAPVFDPRQRPPQAEVLLDVVAAGGTGPAPGFAPLVLFGERDRLPGTDRKAAQRLAASLPGAQLALVPDAGHLPQYENPDAFLAALLPFLEAREHAPPPGA